MEMFLNIIRTIDFISVSNTIMSSKPIIFRVIVEISLYGRCEIPIWPESSKFVKIYILKTSPLNSLLQTEYIGQ